MSRLPAPLPLLALPPNRVRRNYRGGALLDALEGLPSPKDSDRPEDWIASTTAAINPGMPPESGEGVSQVFTESGSQILTDVFASAPDFYLGPRHAARLGPQLGFLAKLLDSAMRLHVQAHPTAAFARQHLNSPWGKFETYVILGARPGIVPTIRLGFQHPPTRSEWRRILVEQDIAAMDAFFEPIPVRPGEVWCVPGGVPHAIGAGVLMLEVMEPTDLVVRCEFEREGIVVPEPARFMNRGVDFALDLFEYAQTSVADAQNKYRIQPRILEKRDDFLLEELIGPAHTDCFTVSRFTANSRTFLPSATTARIGIVASGTGSIRIENSVLPLSSGKKFLLAASAPAAEIIPTSPFELLLCAPGEST